MPFVEVRGADAAPRPSDLSSHATAANVVPKASANLILGRQAAQVSRILIADDDLVELELEGGVRLWTSGAGLAHDATLPTTREGSSADERIVLENLYVRQTETRGAAAFVIKVIKVFGVDPVGDITDFVKKKVESQLQPGPGLYRCEVGHSERLGSPARFNDSGTDSPYLIFLHGTGSSAPVSFGGLWDGGTSSKMSALVKAYSARVLAFQHRSLSESPLRNAIALARELPKGARLHLVSHSRGGLIGELLCRGNSEGGPAFDDRDFGLFEKDRETDLNDLKELSAILTEKELHIERFVRVACPALGTTLADRRLDRYLSVMVNLLELLGLKSNPIFDLFATLLVGVIKNRTRPEELPGLEAMMPDSPLVALLNRRDRRSKSDLHILGGDVEGSGLFGRLKVLATDVFYREDHDLVVNTPAMFGGVQRTDPVRYWVDQGHTVNHFGYFRNAPTADRMMSALTAPGGLDYHTLEKGLGKAAAPVYQLRATNQRPAVFVLPGIMGSQLTVNGNPVWLDLDQIATGLMTELAIGAIGVAASDPIEKGYGDLIRFLAQTHDVVPLPYDWRRPVSDSAAKLNKRMVEKLEDTHDRQPIRVLAHSMGGLVFKAMLATDDGAATWKRACAIPGSRVVMLGTPSRGSHAIAAMMMGRDRVVSRLALLDLRNSYSQLLAIITGFPGVLDLLPDSGPQDLFSAEAWKRLHDVDATLPRGWTGTAKSKDKPSGVLWPLPDGQHLEEARRRRSALDSIQLDPEWSIYVAGRAPATPSAIDLFPPANPTRVRVLATSQGDGRVTWATGIPPGTDQKVWYMDAVHGDMTNNTSYFPAISDLLATGTTKRLSKLPPATRGGQQEEFEIHLRAPEMFPNEAELTASVLGGTAQPESPPTQKVLVRVVHGDLSQAESPVLAGHYQGDAIVSAERFLDRVLKGRLTERHLLELYPGPRGSAEVFLNEGEGGHGFHPGAIIIGLDKVGELTPGELTSATIRGTLSYAVRLKERQGLSHDGASDGTAEINAEITSLLIGSGGGGLTVADSIQSIMRGVLEANRRLDNLQSRQVDGDGDSSDSIQVAHELADRRVRITKLEFRELYEDRAIQAERELRELAKSSEFEEHVEIDKVVRRSSGGVRRASFEEDTGWWRRLRISVTEDGAVSFSALSDRARSASFLQPTQKKVVDNFLRQAQTNTSTDLELSHTLFEILLPNELKERARDRRNLVLQLDDRSAVYPWELLRDSFNEGLLPLAVQAGMVRQLDVHRFREQIATSVGNNALVVGDPLNEDPRFPPLPGAQDEALHVVDILTKHSQPLAVHSLVGAEATASSVLRTLYARPYRIVHMAAHGVFDFDPDGLDDSQKDDSTAPTTDNTKSGRKISGMALGGGMFLTAAEIDQMRYVPDLVFLNCCHLGQAEGEYVARYHELAANLSIQLIRMGVRAVIAAGWAVGDAAAKTFASTFYRAFLSGAPFGEAVQLARRETFMQHPDMNTWGAYQCYGDPAYSWIRKDLTASHDLSTDQVALSEALVDLENLTTRQYSASQRVEVEARLQELSEKAPQDWVDSAALQGALGRAYGHVHSYEKAIECCLKALELHPTEVSLDTVERLVEYRVGLAESLFSSVGDDVSRDEQNKLRASARNEFTRAEELAELVLKVAKTPQRWRALGALHRCRARVETRGDNKRSALKAMSAAYLEEYQLVAGNKQRDVRAEAEALLNQLSAQILLGLIESPSEALQRDITANLKKLEALSTAPSIDETFQKTWIQSAHEIFRSIAAGSMDSAKAAEISKALKKAAAAARRDELAFAHELLSFVGSVESQVLDSLAPVLATLPHQSPG